MKFITVTCEKGLTHSIPTNQIHRIVHNSPYFYIKIYEATIHISMDDYIELLRHLDRVVIDTKNNKTPKDLKCENESSKGIKSFVCKSLQKIITKLEQFNTKLKGE